MSNESHEQAGNEDGDDFGGKTGITLEEYASGIDVLNVVAQPDVLASGRDDSHVQKPARRRKRGIDLRAHHLLLCACSTD